MKVMVTGGAGYLGSHVCLALAEAGYQAVLLDRLTDPQLTVLHQLSTLSPSTIVAERGDLIDTAWVCDMLDRHQPACVIHLAHGNGWPATPSHAQRHLSSNLLLLGSVLRAMEARNIHTLQIASSAEVYGASEQGAFVEGCPQRPLSYIGLYHHLIEGLLDEMRRSNAAWRIAVLRHFNPAGAHPSGLLGQRVPLLGQASLTTRLARACLLPDQPLAVCGHHHPTPDGFPVADLTHIQDVAEAHVAALDTLLDYDEGFTVNIGTGQGRSLFEVIAAFESANARQVPWQFGTQREVDVSHQVANCELAVQLLGWRARRCLSEICVDTLSWQRHLLEEQAPASR